MNMARCNSLLCIISSEAFSSKKIPLSERKGGSRKKNDEVTLALLKF
jgi:hypothetical protein